ncbi:MAG: hypothetical protein LBF86_02545 [Helicobacteraceae bacterium]|jgi:hypothetical protein|nr:hypothetical protein [Helicobacteraceae bacterium]
MRAILLVLALAACGFAHKINLFVTDENATIYIQSYFTKSAPCKECAVWIFDQNAKEIATAKTDENGKAAIAINANKIIVRVDGGMGHQAQIDYELTGEFAEEAETPLWISLAKGALSLGAIALFFAALRLIKREKAPASGRSA